MRMWMQVYLKNIGGCDLFVCATQSGIDPHGVRPGQVPTTTY